MTDPGQFEEFVRTYQDMVFGTAIRLLGDASEAEDAAQTVFLKAFERFDTVGGSPTAAGWLRTVTRNVCLNHLSRYRARRRLFSEMETDTHESGGYGDHLPSTDVQSGTSPDAISNADLETALRSLPDGQRIPLVLFHFDGANYQEIANLLGISLGKVKTDIHRGRKALMHFLADDYAAG